MILRYCAAGAKLVAVNRADRDAQVRPAVRDFRPLRAADAAALGSLPEFTVPAMGSVTLDLKV